jgi:hypothetical protein
MSTIAPIATIPLPVPRAGRSLGLRIGLRLALRIALVPVFVALCYLLQWWWLRIATTTALVSLSGFLGVPMQRIGPDVVTLDGLAIQFIIPCTMVDAFFGAIPLLWRRSAGWRNLPRLAAVFAGVCALNLFRLELGFVGLHRGVSWWLAHEVVAGLAYFAVFLLIVETKAWQEQPFDGRVK